MAHGDITEYLDDGDAELRASGVATPRQHDRGCVMVHAEGTSCRVPSYDDWPNVEAVAPDPEHGYRVTVQVTITVQATGFSDAADHARNLLGRIKAGGSATVTAVERIDA